MKQETGMPQPETLPGQQFPVKPLFAGVACRGPEVLSDEPEVQGLLHGQHQPPDRDHQSLLHRILL